LGVVDVDAFGVVDGAACGNAAGLPAAAGSARFLADWVAEPVPAVGAVVVDDGLLDPLGVPVGDAGVVEELTLPPVTGWNTGTAGITTPRKLRTAALPNFATSVFVLPGIEITIWLEPWMTTVASVTPEPFTRFSMICLAWFIDDFDGVLPVSVVFAVKMTCVPPTRSRPNLGVCRAPGQNTIV
jgi:hypothetical protein